MMVKEHPAANRELKAAANQKIITFRVSISDKCQISMREELKKELDKKIAAWHDIINAN